MGSVFGFGEGRGAWRGLRGARWVWGWDGVGMGRDVTTRALWVGVVTGSKLGWLLKGRVLYAALQLRSYCVGVGPGLVPVRAALVLLHACCLPCRMPFLVLLLQTFMAETGVDDSAECAQRDEGAVSWRRGYLPMLGCTLSLTGAGHRC